MKVTRYVILSSMFFSLAATPALANEVYATSTKNASAIGVCLRAANKTYREALNAGWKTRSEAISKAWETLKTARKAALDKFTVAHKAAVATRDAALDKAKQDKSKDERLAAWKSYQETMKLVRETYKSEREAAWKAFSETRKAAVDSWQASRKAAWDRLKSAQDACRK